MLCFVGVRIVDNIAFIFPGQASQFVGMANDFHSTHTEAQELFSRANDLLGFDLEKVCFHGPDERLRETDVTQPAVFVHSIIVLRLLEAEGIFPSVVAGHSLGEYSALVAAGALEFEEALTLVGERSRSMLKVGISNQGTMAAIIGLDAIEVSRLCELSSDIGVVVPANFNAPGQTVISGVPRAVNHVGELCKEAGAKRVVGLSVSGAFHSPLMTNASDRMRHLLENANMLRPRIPVVTNVSAKKVDDPDILTKDLISQITHSVNWTESMEALLASNVDLVVEVGPGQVLKGLMRRISRDAQVACVGTVEEFTELVAMIKGDRK